MSSKTASQVRASFLDFFKGKGHEVCASAPLIPQNDPTLMFTNAGMVPFKDVFTGKDRRPFSRATSSQKCIRISGKHNDLENVGVTARHHTFFEMLGNFSFGDYFKEDAIAWAWELITGVWEIPKERLVVTVFGGADGVPADDEARAIWRKVTGFGDDRILGIPNIPGDNFWQMGETGPCGPCTELHYFTGDGEPNVASFGEEPTPDGKGWMEIWNLVFMQFERSGSETAGYTLAPLPKPCVDTGAGLERVTSVLQGKASNYETDLLRALVDATAALARKSYRGSQADDDVSMRVIADHARLTAFLIAEGISPDRVGRPYVLRRVMRRAIRHGHRLGINEPFLHAITAEVVKLMGGAFPELVQREALIFHTTLDEEIRFRQTMTRGLELIEKNKVWRMDGERRILPGEIAFKLYDTFGYPLDLTQVIARERGFEVDVAGFEAAMERARQRSEGSKVGEEALEDVWRQIERAYSDTVSVTDQVDAELVTTKPPTQLIQPTSIPSGEQFGTATVTPRLEVQFTGYEREQDEGWVIALVNLRDGKQQVKSAGKGDNVVVVTNRTPFYGESGGQVGDRGEIRGANGLRIQVDDTKKPLPNLVAHIGRVVEGEVSVGDRVELEVDHGLRMATRRNHSATHLLHWALRKVVGESAQQKGSLVGPDRLRFDYSSGRPLTPEEIQRIEDLVNEKILSDAPVTTEVLPQAEAKKRGAMAIFEEKYGDVVRVLTMTKDSVELCGGTHARALGEIGMFKILSDGGVAAGVRRVEAATGTNALAYVRQLEATIKNAARLVKSAPTELPEKIEKLLEDSKKLDKELADTKRKLAMGGGGPSSGGGGGVDAWAAEAKTLPFGKVLAVKVDVGDAGVLRELAEKLRDKLGDAIVLVGSVAGPKAMLVLTVSKSLTDRYKAGELIRPVAQILGGSGGGRPDMAQAGGTEIAKIDEALEKLYALVTG